MLQYSQINPRNEPFPNKQKDEIQRFTIGRPHWPWFKLAGIWKKFLATVKDSYRTWNDFISKQNWEEN